MKIDLNKEYHTRDGHKVTLNGIDSNQVPYYIGGFIHNEGLTPARWTVEGRFLEGITNRYDLVPAVGFTCFKANHTETEPEPIRTNKQLLVCDEGD